MVTINIRNIDEDLERRLRIQAAQHARPIEDEARDILRNALFEQAARAESWVKAVRAEIEIGSVNLEIPPREPMREPPDFV